MNLNEFKACLQAYPELNLSIALPDGRRVPVHYHVTEVGHVVRKFVDCGGAFRTAEACVLQTYIGSLTDDGHRLTAGKLVKILGLADPLFASGELPVEVEYEDGLISQFPVKGAGLVGDTVTLELGRKHTDCLAKEKCGISDESCGCTDETEPAETTGCCAGLAGSRACC